MSRWGVGARDCVSRLRGISHLVYQFIIPVQQVDLQQALEQIRFSGCRQGVEIRADVDQLPFLHVIGRNHVESGNLPGFQGQAGRGLVGEGDILLRRVSFRQLLDDASLIDIPLGFFHFLLGGEDLRYHTRGRAAFRDA